MDLYTKIINSERPLVMGILNLTADSFFDGGKYSATESMIAHAEQMLEEGADIIDIGASSSRPGSIPVPEMEELNTIEAALKVLLPLFPQIVISADTFRASVAKIAVREGAAMINDISGGALDEKMFDTIAALNIPYVLMHMQNTPETMQLAPQYENVTREIQHYFEKKLRELRTKGISKIILDPGFGFGKNLDHNYQLLKDMPLFGKFELPILAGVSRKGMINKVIGSKPENALNGTTVVNTIALLNGARLLRVHDVKEAVEAIKLVQQYKRSYS
jgi:dihydropteroate synthase